MALVIALIAALLMTALGTALVLNTSAETMIASNYREAQEGIYAADAAFERTRPEFQVAGSWNPLLAGAVRSAFVDGPASGKTDAVRWIEPRPCQPGQPRELRESDRLQFGRHEPRDRRAPLGRQQSTVAALRPRRSSRLALLPRRAGWRRWVGRRREPAGRRPGPGAGVLEVRAEAFGPRGSHHRVDVTLAREGAPGGPGAGGWRAWRGPGALLARDPVGKALLDPFFGPHVPSD